MKTQILKISLILLLGATAQADTTTTCQAVNTETGYTDFSVVIKWGDFIPQRVPNELQNRTFQKAHVTLTIPRFYPKYNAVFVTTSINTRCGTGYIKEAWLEDLAKITFASTTYDGCRQLGTQNHAELVLHPKSSHPTIYQLQCQDEESLDQL